MELTMVQEKYNDYIITALPVRKAPEKWAVCAKIEKRIGNTTKGKMVYAEDKIYYILEIEAAKESINLGKNLIKNNMIGF